MAYQLEGRLLEVCNCDVICPCWVGENPDKGTCEAILAWHVDSGTVNGTDVSNLTFASFAHIPHNVLDPHSWKVVIFMDDKATPEQSKALLDAWTGKLGGPLADLAQLIGEVVAVECVPISFTVELGEGTVKIGSLAEATMAPLHGATGLATVLAETAFSSVPGSPAYVSKASQYRRDSSHYGLANVDLQGHNAVQGHFRFAA